jgi:hypothetical protein
MAGKDCKSRWCDKIELVRVDALCGITPSNDHEIKDQGNGPLGLTSDEVFGLAYLVGNMGVFLEHLYEDGPRLAQRRGSQHVAYITHSPPPTSKDPVVVKCHVLYGIYLMLGDFPFVPVDGVDYGICGRAVMFLDYDLPRIFRRYLELLNTVRPGGRRYQLEDLYITFEMEL